MLEMDDFRYRDRQATAYRPSVPLSWAFLARARPLSALAGIGELEGVHQLNVAVVGEGLRGVGGGGNGILPLVGVAVGVDFALVAAQLSRSRRERDHLLVGGDRFRSLVLLAVDDAETVEEDERGCDFSGSV